jgi:caffeoyl-CoA O-methyltransferase
MSPIVDPAVEDYAERHTTPVPPYLADLAEETRADFEAHGMMVGRLEGRFLEMLVYALKPRLVLEIGTFTGYSALSMASALPEGGRIISCDVDERSHKVASRHVAQSPYADLIELRMGPALDTIATLDGPFDFVFIDADKTNYVNYYEAVLPKLSPGGLLAADNTLWSGRVVEPDDAVDAGDENTKAIKAFNDHVAGDGRVVCVQLTVRDGVTLIRKRD